MVEVNVAYVRLKKCDERNDRKRKELCLMWMWTVREKWDWPAVSVSIFALNESLFIMLLLGAYWYCVRWLFRRVFGYLLFLLHVIWVDFSLCRTKMGEFNAYVILSERNPSFSCSYNSMRSRCNIDTFYAMNKSFRTAKYIWLNDHVSDRSTMMLESN